MASKAFGIICDAELGKSHALPMGRNFVRSNDGAGDIGDGKKQKATCNELHRGLCLSLKRR